MEHQITTVEKGSIAEGVGLLPGDILLSINGESIIDEIDYQYLCSADDLCIVVRRGTEEIEFDFSKEDGEPLGVHFGDSMVLKPRPCQNQCIFCFISQMPPHLRPSLYVKDDDWRFSLMMGNFITLTNISEMEFQRIINRRVSPLYISVHTTNPELRCRMMNNPHAGTVMDKLKMLKDAGIKFHCQIVTCPGWNDGDELIKTLSDLKSLWPAARSVAMVPVGLTKYRENLPALKGFTEATAGNLLDQLKPFQSECMNQLGTHFAFCSDEFYTLSHREVPPEDWYEDFPQIENGVGLIRKLLSEIEAAYRIDKAWGIQEPKQKKHYYIPTGVSFADTMKSIAKQYAPPKTEITVIPVVNHFFGEKVTVTGLLTGQDLLDALKSLHFQNGDEILLSSSVLRNERDLFLDNMSFKEFQSQLPVSVHLLENNGDILYEAFYQRFDQNESEGVM